MTQIDFYVLKASDHLAALHYCCRLTEKAFRAGHRVYIHVSDAQEASQLDDMLWSFRPDSFVPHEVFDGQGTADVAIGYGDSPGDHMDVMVNLALDTPAFFSRFKRLGEVVYQNPERLQALRSRWKAYKDSGYPLKKHDV